MGGAFDGAITGFATGGIIGGITGGIFTPKGHSIWTGNPLRQPITTIQGITKGVNIAPENFPKSELSLRAPVQIYDELPQININIKNRLDGGIKFVSQFSNKTIDKAVNLVINDPNKLNHLFPARHNLGTLVNKLGGQENTVRAVLNAANGKLPVSGVFIDIPVKVGGQTILIRGNVINGIPRLGTMFIP